MNTNSNDDSGNSCSIALTNYTKRNFLSPQDSIDIGHSQVYQILNSFVSSSIEQTMIQIQKNEQNC